MWEIERGRRKRITRMEGEGGKEKAEKGGEGGKEQKGEEKD